MKIKYERMLILIGWLMINMVLLTGCNFPAFQTTATPPDKGLDLVEIDQPDSPAPKTELVTDLPMPTATTSPQPEPNTTHTESMEAAGTKTPIPAFTDTPTSTEATPEQTQMGPDQSGPTPTYDFPDGTILMQANCRYGPGKAYLYSHGLYPDDLAEVHGRNYSGTWLWIKPENLNRHCWAAASVMEVVGDISVLKVVQTSLPKSNLYGPPQNVQAERNGDFVLISWEPVWMTQDDYRGYLIEATVCQNGAMVWVAMSVDGNTYELLDEESCSVQSSGQIYTVEKHGYTDPVPIPWPD